MKITYLGQAGLLLEKGDFRIMVDPYLSHSVEKVNPQNYRRVAVDEAFLKIKPHVLIFTHNHLDHYDPETVTHFLGKESRVLVLASRSVWEEVRKFGGHNNYVVFNRHTSWTENGIKFTAVKAEHSDPDAIGVLIEDEKKTYYITGDTLYNEEIFGDLPNEIDVLFLPVNGVGNNMNMADGIRFAKRVRPQKAVPFHIGLFDEKTADAFEFENKVIAEIYKEVKL